MNSRQMTGSGGEGAAAPESSDGYEAYQAAATAFVVLFCIVGVALWGLPFYYDFMVQKFGWTRAQVTSGNALSKLVVGPVFGFLAGWVIDRFGPRRLMMIGIVMAGAALAGLGWVSSLGLFYFFYFFNALGYVCGGPLPNQVLLTGWFDRSRGKAMGFAYLGIGIGGATVPWISHALVQHFGWQAALRILGSAIVAISLPLAFFVREPVKEPPGTRASAGSAQPANLKAAFRRGSFYLLTLGSMCSIAAVSGTQQNLKLLLSLDRHFTQRDAAGDAVAGADVQHCGTALDGLAGGPGFRRSTSCCLRICLSPRAFLCFFLGRRGLPCMFPRRSLASGWAATT